MATQALASSKCQDFVSNDADLLRFLILESNCAINREALAVALHKDCVEDKRLESTLAGGAEQPTTGKQSLEKKPVVQ
jgi:hypothetical protein